MKTIDVIARSCFSINGWFAKDRDARFFAAVELVGPPGPSGLPGLVRVNALRRATMGVLKRENATTDDCLAIPVDKRGNKVVSFECDLESNGWKYGGAVPALLAADMTQRACALRNSFQPCCL